MPIVKVVIALSYSMNETLGMILYRYDSLPIVYYRYVGNHMIPVPVRRSARSTKNDSDVSTAEIRR
jgi:hypothetical protein